ncbi:MAG: phage head-tail connector protein [Akkermansia sp.]|nr:phage head-tail connector protein [Akkermansia sp.]
MVKTLLRVDSADTSEDALITSYLDMAAQEILSWRYSNARNVPAAVPAEYEMTQVQAVINGYTQSGVEGQLSSSENGIVRQFQYSDMTSYIRAHVIPVAGTV